MKYVFAILRLVAALIMAAFLSLVVAGTLGVAPAPNGCGLGNILVLSVSGGLTLLIIVVVCFLIGAAYIASHVTKD